MENPNDIVLRKLFVLVVVSEPLLCTNESEFSDKTRQ